MTDAIIFDIDGTLADCEHRRHHVAGNSKNWGAFFAEMEKDPPNTDVAWLSCLMAHGCENLRMVQEHLQFPGPDGPPALFIVSGRPEQYRAATVNWLTLNCRSLMAEAEALLMRPDGDHRQDVEVKRDILENIRGQGFNVRLAIDDRPSVVRMWRDAGVTCLQVNDGWEESKYESGDLHLLIGPSGAGKSTLAASLQMSQTIQDTGILSSDALREELTGDFKRQDKNQQVFDAMHSIARARLRGGLKVLIDSTNIKTADRRKYLDLAPADCRILYHVVNRPMADKIKDGGWRNGVSVKGMPLMEYHERTFQSNLKAILAGDGDSRVQVVDWRRAEGPKLVTQTAGKEYMSVAYGTAG